MQLTTLGWISQYKQKGALWIHDGNPKNAHALLTSGQHSSGFFNSRLVINDEALLKEAALDLLELFAREDGNLHDVQSVVGPQTGAARLSELISDEIERSTRRSCIWASPAKHESYVGKSMVFTKEDKGFIAGSAVLLCEDVLTTGGSVDLAASSVTDAGGTILPFVLVLVNRSGLTHVSGKKIVALIDQPMPMWTPEECPLCTAGSEAVRPKDNWARLHEIH